MNAETATRAQIERWFGAALDAVDPARCVRESLAELDLTTPGRLRVLAIGKAAVAMYQGAVEVLGSRIEQGLIVTKSAPAQVSFDTAEVILAGHPSPNEESVRAGKAAADLVAGLGERDLMVALISGGGSALLEMPLEPITLEDFQQTTRQLMAAGADIHELNAVRTAISGIKGGGLRRLIGDARCVTLLISDVIGSAPTTIASGPTIVADEGSAHPMDILKRFGLDKDVPESVRSVLVSDDRRALFGAGRDIVEVIADNAKAVTALAQCAQADGLTVAHAWNDFEGPIGDLADAMLTSIRESEDDVLVGGGEATVVVHGDGRGGRNSAAMAEVLRRADSNASDWMFASLATDGDDGNSGAAGAIVHTDIHPGDEEWKRIDEQSDSASVLGQSGALVITGSTGTNVNDVYIAVRMHRGD